MTGLQDKFLAGKRKYIFAQESFYLQGILDDKNEQDTSSLDCKQISSPVPYGYL